jgi:hypothetical protein
VYFGNHERGLFGIEYFVEDAESDGDQRQLPHCRHIHSSPASQTGLDQGMQSLQHCIAQHKACAATDARLPKRLIDIGLVGTDCDPVSVFETHRSQKLARARSQMQYTILSYCWGSESLVKAEMLRPTKENFDELAHGIDLSLLPRVFNDAVKVTRYLGYRYLWIDAMCIAQGDESGEF